MIFFIKIKFFSLQSKSLFENSKKLARNLGANVDKCLLKMEKIDKISQKIKHRVDQCLNIEVLDKMYKSIQKNITALIGKIEEYKSKVLASHQSDPDSRFVILSKVSYNRFNEIENCVLLI